MNTEQAKLRFPPAHGGTMAHGSPHLQTLTTRDTRPHRRSMSLQHLPNPANPGPVFSSTESEEENSLCRPTSPQRTPPRNKLTRASVSPRKSLRKSSSANCTPETIERRRPLNGFYRTNRLPNEQIVSEHNPQIKSCAVEQLVSAENFLEQHAERTPRHCSVQPSPQHRKHNALARSISANSDVLAKEKRLIRRYSVDCRSPRSSLRGRIFKSEPGTPTNKSLRSYGHDFSFERDSYLSENSLSSSSSSSLNELNWSEYSARKGIVRFRSRKSAQERRTPVAYSTPSQLVHKVFHNQYEIARSPDTRLVDKLMAIFYCWYFGWLTDVYNSLTSYGQDRSLVRWSISCVLVSSATVLVASLLIALLFFALQFTTSILEAGLWFVLTIVSIFIFCLCIIAIFNFD